MAEHPLEEEEVENVIPDDVFGNGVEPGDDFDEAFLVAYNEEKKAFTAAEQRHLRELGMLRTPAELQAARAVPASPPAPVAPPEEEPEEEAGPPGLEATVTLDADTTDAARNVATNIAGVLANAGVSIPSLIGVQPPAPAPESEDKAILQSQMEQASTTSLDGGDAPAATEEFDNDFWEFTDVVEQLLGGIRDGVAEAIDTGVDIATLGNNEFSADDYLFAFGKNDPTNSTVGNFARPAAQFMIGFLPIMGAFKYAKWGMQVSKMLRNSNFAKATIAGAFTDFTLFDPHQARLANMTRDMFGWKDPISGWLAMNEEDGKLLGRTKNAIEGSALGFTAEGFIRSAGWAIRASRGKFAAWMTKHPDAVIKPLMQAANDVTHSRQVLSDLISIKERLGKLVGGKSSSPIARARAAIAEEAEAAAGATRGVDDAALDAADAAAPAHKVDKVGENRWEDGTNGIRRVTGAPAKQGKYQTFSVADEGNADGGWMQSYRTLKEAKEGLKSVSDDVADAALDATDAAAAGGREVADAAEAGAAKPALDPEVQQLVDSAELRAANSGRTASEEFEDMVRGMQSEEVSLIDGIARIHPELADAARALHDRPGMQQAIDEAMALNKQAEVNWREAVFAPDVEKKTLLEATELVNEFGTPHLKEVIATTAEETAANVVRATQVAKAAGLTVSGGGKVKLVPSILDTGVRVTKEQNERLLNALRSDDLDELGAAVFETTNYDKFENVGDFQKVLDGLSRLYTTARGSSRQVTVQTNKETAERAAKILADEAELNGSTVGRAAEAIEELLPATQDLAVKVQIINAVEQGLAHRVAQLAKAVGDPSLARDIDKAAFIRMATLAATYSDARAGIVSNIARAMQSLRISRTAATLGENVHLQQDLRRIINSSGGDENIERAARLYQASSATREGRRRFQQLMISRTDRAFNMVTEWWLNSILSALGTQALNIGSNTAVGFYLPSETVMKGLITGSGATVREGVDMYLQFGYGLTEVIGLVGAAQRIAVDVGAANFGKALKGFKDIRPDDFAHIKEGSAFKSFKEQRLITVDEPGAGAFKEGNVEPIHKAISTQNVDGILAGTRFGKKFSNANKTRVVLDALGTGVNLPGRFLLTGDEIAKGINFNVQLRARALRLGRKMNLEGQELDAFVAKASKDAPVVEQLTHLDKATASMLRTLKDDASNYARQATFTDALYKGSYSETLQRAIVHHPWARFIVPFVRTPINLLKFVGHRFPGLGALLGEQRDMIKAGGDQAATVIARQITAMGLWLTAINMAFAGKLTGRGPSNVLERKNLEGTGWKPYAIPVEDDQHVPTFVEFNRGDPFGTFLSLAADYAEITGNLDEAERDDMTMAMVGALAHNILGKSYYTGLAQALKAVEEVQQKRSGAGGRYLARLIGSFVVPNFFNQIGKRGFPLALSHPMVFGAKALVFKGDNTMRVTETVGDVIKDRLRFFAPNNWALVELGKGIDAVAEEVPGFSSSLPARRNLLYEVVTYPPGYGPDNISNFYQTKSDNTIVGNEIKKLSRLGGGVRTDQQKLFRNIGASDGLIKLTPWQGDDLHRFTTDDPNRNGRTLTWELEKLIQSNDYQKLSDGGQGVKGGKAKRIEGVITMRREKALRPKGRFFTKYPELLDQIRRRRKASGLAWHKKNDNRVRELLAEPPNDDE